MPWKDPIVAKQKRREWYLNNREEALRKRAEYVATHKQQCLETDRKYYARVADSDECKSKQRARYLKRNSVPEYRKRQLEQQKEYQKKNPEKVKAAHRRRWANPEYRAKIKRQNERWRLNNKERFAENGRKWRKNNPGKYHALLHKRRARQLNATVNPQSIQIFIEGIRKSKSVKCYYCEKPVPGKKAHIDHMMPLSKGGPHSVENLCASCPHCNHTKHSKLIRDWMRLGQQLLEL